MKAKMFSRKRLGLWLGLVLILLVILALLVSRGYSKYRAQVVVANEVRFVNQLAKEFKLTDKDGVSGTYQLIPGTTLTVDPVITVTGKTEIPAYLFLEVDGLTADFELNENWSPICDESGEQFKGKNGGLMYVYSEILTRNDESVSYHIMANGGTFALSPIPVTSGNVIKLYGYMIQETSEAQTPEQAFAEAFPAP